MASAYPVIGQDQRNRNDYTTMTGNASRDSNSMNFPTQAPSCSFEFESPPLNQTLFQCGICRLVFNTNVEFVKHVQNHSRIKPFQCGYCKVSYDTNPELTVHVQTHSVFWIHGNQPNPNQNVIYKDMDSSDVSDADARSKTRPPCDENKTGDDQGEIRSVANIGLEVVLENLKQYDKKLTSVSEILAEAETSAYNQGTKQKSKEDTETKDSSEETNDDSAQESETESRKPARRKPRNTDEAEKCFKCDICGAGFRLARYMKDHQKRSKTCQRTVPSEVANGVSSPSASESEEEEKPDPIPESDENEEAKKTFPCEDCGKILKSSLTLKRHRQYVHTDERPFPCPHCPSRFKAKNAMQDHVAFIHNGEMRFKCCYCSAHMKTRKQLDAHMRNKHENENPHECVHCSALFSQETYLSAHVADKHTDAVVQNPDKNIKCSQCNLKFRTKSRVARHMARVHQNVCLHCGKSFKTKRQLTNHMITGHSTEKPFQCTDCGKCFRVKATLSEHFCKPRQCPLCNDPVNSKSSLKAHMRRKHAAGTFSCSYCGKLFVTRRELDNHTRTHTKEKPFTCEFCGQSFPRPSNLAYHRSSRHLNNRPFKCNICQKGFNSYPGLWQHKRRHLGDKRYPCTQCEMEFYNSSSLRRHTLTHTGKNVQNTSNRPSSDPVFVPVGHQTKPLYVPHPVAEVTNRMPHPEIPEAKPPNYQNGPGPGISGLFSYPWSEQSVVFPPL